MELLQKITPFLSAGSPRWRQVLVWTGIFCFLFSAAGVGSLNALASPRIVQTLECNTVLPQHGHGKAMALWENTTPQLAQTVLRRVRTSQQHTSPWRLRAVLHTTMEAFAELLPQHQCFRRQAIVFSLFQRYLKTSLPVRAGPFHS